MRPAVTVPDMHRPAVDPMGRLLDAQGGDKGTKATTRMVASVPSWDHCRASHFRN
ncbi:hypothetical protein M404DRAFT_998032 [Pisolithus tinctorius Marx 270]|uniref:Uncharacterized protein n=1 Tax=Pisolithus tinctorius Marx 270 TaxID=870435 RepID=A0A0C3P4B6_PISTI|nr:hypothetical protein M404DRAFT_998032 [Pisolithus tinctorius Marx 270]